MSADILILGNGEVRPDVTGDVAAAGCVVRFNMAPNYGVRTGTRCDVLAINNTGSWARRLARDGFLADQPFARGCRTVLFPRPVSPRWKRIALRLANRTWRSEYSRGILAANGLLGKDIVHLPAGFAAECLRMLLELGEPRVRPRAPSTGFLVLEHYLRTRPEAEIAMAGFAFSGWKRHPFDLERLAVERYAREGRVTVLDPPATDERGSGVAEGSLSQTKRTI